MIAGRLYDFKSRGFSAALLRLFRSDRFAIGGRHAPPPMLLPEARYQKMSALR